MIILFDKDTINKYIVPHLSKAKRGYECKAELWEVVNAIFYKFKTGVQWKYLPIKSLISSVELKYGAVYHHFRKWAKDGSWQRVWKNLLFGCKHLLDLSIANLDGTHTPCKRGGEQVAYQGRKKCKTSNTLWLTDRKGHIVGFAPPCSGNHNDLFEIQDFFENLLEMTEQATIEVAGLFLNADAGFDSKNFRQLCKHHDIVLNAPINKRNRNNINELNYYFDETMYENRYVVERTNAWLDANRSFIIRYDTTQTSWIAWHFIACIKHWLKINLKV